MLRCFLKLFSCHVSSNNLSGVGKFCVRLFRINRFLRIIFRLLVTANLVPNSPILVTLMTEAIRSSWTLVRTRSTRRNIAEDGILHSHRREYLKSYIPTDAFTVVLVEVPEGLFFCLVGIGVHALSLLIFSWQTMNCGDITPHRYFISWIKSIKRRNRTQLISTVFLVKLIQSTNCNSYRL
jgi:hypothetical protein